MSDLKMHNYGTGVVEPVSYDDLLPASLNNALGATAAYDAWQAANTEGAAAQAALTASRNEWVATHPQQDYTDRDAWLFACDLDNRPLAAAVTAATRVSVAALHAYDDAQRAGFKAAKGSFAAAYLDADRRAREAWAIVDAAIVEREALMRYVIIPEHSSQIGLGHFLYASALGTNKSANAQHQREAMALVVNTAPRNLVTVKAPK